MHLAPQLAKYLAPALFTFWKVLWCLFLFYCSPAKGWMGVKRTVPYGALGIVCLVCQTAGEVP